MMKKGNSTIYVTGIFFFIGVLAGAVFVNLSCRNRTAEEFLLNRDMLMQIPYMEIKRRKLFLLIMQSRLRWFLFFCLLAATPLAYRTMYLFGIWLGYGAGSLLALSVVQYKAFGILVFLAALMPQALLLLPGSLGIMARVSNAAGKGVVLYGRSRFKSVVSFLVFAGMFLAGVLLECYVNPLMLSLFVKFFL